MGFYLLRLALWNTYGTEIITFENNQLNYIADYGWFKDGRKTKELTAPIKFMIQPLGYEEDYKGKMVILLSNEKITCVTVMPLNELQELINRLTQNLYKSTKN